MGQFESENQKRIYDDFFNLNNIYDIAKLLNIKPRKLSFILYKLNGGRENQYKDFEIKKRSGGKRIISAPDRALKKLQSNLNTILQIVYKEKPSVHSFIKNRSIISNAAHHTNKKYVFKIDLEDFFPSINFGRVRGLFIHPPYNLHENAATVIAQISCYNNQLPQGSPCSLLAAP